MELTREDVDPEPVREPWLLLEQGAECARQDAELSKSNRARERHLAVAEWLEATSRHLRRGNLHFARDLCARDVARAYIGFDE